jgi:hypothetical protein
VSLWIISGALLQTYFSTNSFVFAVERVPIHAISTSFSKPCDPAKPRRVCHTRLWVSQKTLGSIKGIRKLRLYYSHGSRDFHPFQAVTDALKNTHSLRVLGVGLRSYTFRRDPSGLTALSNDLGEHTGPLLEAASRDLSPGVVLRALSACPLLQLVSITTTCASSFA